MKNEQTRPIVAFCAVSVLALGAMLAVANRPPETHYQAGPLPEPITEALSPDFLLGDLLDARAAAAERKAERRAEARRKPRFVLPFHSAAPSSGQVVRVAAPGRSTGATRVAGRRTDRTATTKRASSTTTHPSKGSGHHSSPGRTGHHKSTAPADAHRGHARKTGKRAKSMKVETRRLSRPTGRGHGRR